MQNATDKLWDDRVHSDNSTLSGCASFWKPEKEVVTVTKIVERNIPTIPHPKPVQMNDVKIYVVSPEENFEEFKKEFEKRTVRFIYCNFSEGL